MKQVECRFYPIVGGNSIGASSYYLGIGDKNIILDCGSKTSGINKLPNYYEFENSICDLSDLDLVVLSHAHFDHIGALPNLGDKLLDKTKIVSTKSTKKLIESQLINLGRDCLNADTTKVKFSKRLRTERVAEKITEVPVNEEFYVNGIKVKFLSAGHMPGAVMTYLTVNGVNVLYTGDFSFETMNGINKADENKIFDLDVDVLIVNATSAYKKYTIENNYKTLLSEVKRILNRGGNVCLSSNSIPKHLDLFYLINNSGLDISVYLSLMSENIAQELENIGFNIYSTKIQGYREKRDIPHIFFGKADELYEYEEINVDLYSLHETYEDLEMLIENLKPKQTFVVHAVKIDTENIIDDFKKENFNIVHCKDEVCYEF